MEVIIMDKVNVDVNVLIANQKNIQARLENLLDDKSRREFEEIKKLPPELQREWAIETTERIAREYREYLKEGDYIG